MVRYNPHIPGWFTHEDFETIISIAQKVPEHGRVVEFGSAWGRSTVGWARNVPKTAIVYAIDIWSNSFISDERRMHIDKVMHGSQNAKDSLERWLNMDDFKRFTKPCPNILPIQLLVKHEYFRWPHGLVDVFFDDGNHTNPRFASSLNFWWPLVRPGGVICGHDYGVEWWPAVTRTVDQFAERHNAKLEPILPGSSVWVIRKPD